MFGLSAVYLGLRGKAKIGYESLDVDRVRRGRRLALAPEHSAWIDIRPYISFSDQQSSLSAKQGNAFVGLFLKTVLMITG